jgi:CheY-like chemotaxis protein
LPRVLIVEDDEQIRVTAESFLGGEGHEALSAATFDQAIALLEGDTRIDLLLMDLGIQGDAEAG